jgi:hypothetical protein
MFVSNVVHKQKELNPIESNYLNIKVNQENTKEKQIGVVAINFIIRKMRSVAK